jgi:hypothetical protein
MTHYELEARVLPLFTDTSTTMKTTMPHPNQLVCAAAFTLTLWAAATDASAQKFLVDFGGGGAPTTNPADDPLNFWNNVTETIGQNSAGLLPDLVTTANTPTSVDLRMLSRFNGVNMNGTDASGIYPADATRDSLFGNTELFGGLTDIFPSFQFEALDPSKTYDLTFYASRIDPLLPPTQNRETLYTITGGASGSVALNALNNFSSTVTYFGMAPTAAGVITISLSPGPNNNNSNHFTYMGVLELVTVPEPSTALALLTGSTALLLRRRRPAFAA